MNDLSDAQMNEILDLIYQGQRIEAIKQYRELRASSLYDAKQFVDQLEQQLRETSPEKFTVEQRSGCMGLLAIALAAIGLPFLIAVFISTKGWLS